MEERRTPKILVVDDESQQLKLLGAVFRRHNYDYETATNGLEAIKKTKACEPDLILLDVTMPELDGFETCERLKGDPSTQHIPIIVATGLADNDTRLKCLSVGANDFLSKPIDIQELMIRVRNLVALKESKEIKAKHDALLETMKAINTAKQEWELTVDCIDDIIVLVDAEEKILRCNKALSALTGKPNDRLLKERWQDTLREHGFGRMAFDSNQSEFFHPAGRWFVCNSYPVRNTVGTEIATVITMKDITERKQAEDALERSEKEARRLAKENAIMAEIGRIISSTLDVGEVYEHFAEAVRKLIPFDKLVICTVNPQANTMTFAYVKGIEVPGRGPGDTIPLTGTLSGEVIRTQAPLRLQIEEPKEKERFPHLLPVRQAGIRSIMSVPLISRDQVTGVLNFESVQESAYQEPDVSLAEHVAAQIAGAITNARLFSQLKGAEKELRESEDRYRDLVEHSHDMICTHDLDGKILSINRGGSEMLGDEQSVLLKKNIRDILAWRFRDQFDTYIATLRRDGRAAGLMRVSTSSGEKRILEYNNTLRTEGVQEPIVRGLARDITERRRAEEALRKSESKFYELFNEAPVGYHEYDIQGNITRVNKTELEMLGYKVEEVLGQPVWKFVVDEEMSRQAVLTNLSGGQSGNRGFERPYRQKDGTIIPVLVEDRVLREGNGQIIGIRSTVQDITKWKVLESQLVQAQKLEAVGQLAAGIAHEINTPIQYVGDNTRFLMDAFKDMARLLEKYQHFVDAFRTGSTWENAVQEVENGKKEIDLSYLAEEIPKAIKQTLEGVDRVAEIVRAMKEFSHPGPKEKTPANLNRAIENTIMVARNEWKYVAEMVTDFDPHPPLVPCLPNEFNQVVLNLIINAVHAIKDVVGDGSKGTITIATRNTGDTVEIRVSDTGTGIPPAIQTKIFDPFFTTKEVGKGTGQGLTIARSIVVDKHGGTIHFETEPGKGTTFMIHLPLGDESGKAYDKENSLRR